MMPVETSSCPAPVHERPHLFQVVQIGENTLRFCEQCGLTHRLIYSKDPSGTEIMHWEPVQVIDYVTPRKAE